MSQLLSKVQIALTHIKIGAAQRAAGELPNLLSSSAVIKETSSSPLSAAHSTSSDTATVSAAVTNCSCAYRIICHQIQAMQQLLPCQRAVAKGHQKQQMRNDQQAFVS